MRFIDRILELHRHLDEAELPHAFGGAIALAYCTSDPRGTDDIDVNIFVSPGRVDDVLKALPHGVAVTDKSRRQLGQDGQSRLFWDQTPLDLFLSNHPFHGRAEVQAHVQPFEDVALPVLACIDLAVFKAMSARPKDAVDIAAMVAAGCVDLHELTTTVTGSIGRDRDAFLDDVRRFAEHDGFANF